jgi:hypothetical protein
MPDSLKAIWNFARRILIEVAYFLLVAFAAYLLNFFVSWADARDLFPQLILRTLKVLAYVIFYIDILSLLALIVRDALKAGGKIPPA